MRRIGSAELRSLISAELRSSNLRLGLLNFLGLFLPHLSGAGHVHPSPDPDNGSFPLNLSALKGEDSQATLRITTLTLAPEGSHRPHASGF